MKSKTPTSITLLSLAASAACLAHPNGDHAHPPADAASVTQTVFTGSGSELYRSVPGWCQLPDGVEKLGNTHGQIVVDKAGRVYFTTDTQRSIMVYSAAGEFLRAFGENYIGIHGLCLREESGAEYIYAAHLGGSQIVKFDLEGEALWTMAAPAESGVYGPKKAYKPTGITVAPNGDIYVADGYGQNLVHRWNKEREYLGHFGGPGTEPGKFRCCHGIALDTRGEQPLLLVADRENKRLQHFDLEGNFVAVITQGLRRPCGVSIHGDKVAVAELAGRVTILGRDNHPMAFLGDNPNRSHWAKNGVPAGEWHEGVFTAPHGVCYDAAGNLYVMDWNSTGRISKLVRTAEVAGR